MGVERKLNRDQSFKKQKLDKTRRRREGFDHERRLADQRERSGRNDLLPTLQIRNIPIAELRPSPQRTRRTTPEQLERVTSAIASLGFNMPILIVGTQIIDGHVRVEAAGGLGLAEVPAIDCSHLSAAEVRKLRLAANRIAELGEWDMDLLRIEMRELIELDVDLSDTGFASEELDIIILDPCDDEAEEAEPPTPPEVPVTRLGDQWGLNPHRVSCGNALEDASYQQLLGGVVVDAVLSDLPYNVKIKGNVSGLGKKVHDEFVMASGELGDAEWQAFLDKVMVHFFASVSAGAVVFAFMDWRSYHRLVFAGEKAGFSLINLAVWYKQTGGMGGLYRSAHELIPVFCKGDKPKTNNVALGRHGRDRTNVWSMPGANRRGSSANAMLAQHATPKPVELCVDALLDVTNAGERVLDAFLGSGTTLVAAEKTGRVCFGMELDPRFVDVSVRRWQELTGECAVLLETGETFDQVAARRAAEGAGPSDDGCQTQGENND